MPFVYLDYPREVLEIGSNVQKGYRRIVNNSDELKKYWNGKNGISNIYFTAYGYRGTTPPRHHRVDYNTPVIRHFVMDFDCKDFTKRQVDVEFSFMHEQVKRLHKHFLVNDITHYIWFSGGGFHVWVPIEQTLTPNNGFEVSRIKDGGKRLIMKWHKLLDISCNDPTVAFDTAGMIRIPNSYNFKRKCWSIPLNKEELMQLTHFDFLDEAQEPREGYIALGKNPIELEVSNKPLVAFKTKTEIKDLPSLSHEKMLILPCLAQAALGEGNPTHKARFHLVSYLAARLRWFFPPESVDDTTKEEHIEKIVDFCSIQGWVDFDREITHTQVSSIVKGKYSLSTCKTLIDEGFCSGLCMYYDNSAGDLL